MVSLVASDSTATETNATTGAFTVSRTGAATGDLVVNYTVSGTATSGDDYMALPGTLTIPDGQVSAMITLTPLDDHVGEGGETVILTLVTGAAYQRNTTRLTGRVTIADNEPSVSVAASDAQAGEGAGQTGTFTITRAGLTVGALPVTFSINGTATPSGMGVTNADYTAIAGMATIPDGQSSVTVTVTPIDDAIAEPSETVILTLTGTDGYIISTSRRAATVTIADDEPIVNIAATDPTASETHTDTDAGTGTFTISRATAGTTDLTVMFTIGGAATGGGSDYAAITTSATIPSGQTSITVTVTPVDDSVGEGDETVVLTLAANSAYNIQTAQARDRATVTIRDNEPVVRITSTDNTATEQDETSATVTFTRNGADAQLASDLTVLYTVDGTADSGDDYEPLEGVIVIPAGQASMSLTFSAVDDTIGEGNETVILTLEGGGVYGVDATRSSVTVTIVDNEPVVSIAATDAAAGENNNPGVFTISRTGSTDNDLPVTYAVGGAATAGDDYAMLSGVVVIPGGSSSATVTISPLYDLLTEDAEAVVLTITTTDGYRVDPTPARARATVTIANAQAVDLGVSGLSYHPGSFSLASTGVQVPIAVGMNNAGLVAAGLFRYEVRLSLNNTWGDDDDIVVYAGSQRGLDGGMVTSATGLIDFDSIKSRLSAGSYYMACRLDVGLGVVERSRTDNTFFSTSADFVVTV
jgi:hypothetical protein